MQIISKSALVALAVLVPASGASAKCLVDVLTEQSTDLSPIEFFGVLSQLATSPSECNQVISRLSANVAGASEVGKSTTSADCSDARAVWADVKASKSKAVLESYLKSYGHCPIYAALAQDRVANIQP